MTPYFLLRSAIEKQPPENRLPDFDLLSDPPVKKTSGCSMINEGAYKGYCYSVKPGQGFHMLDVPSPDQKNKSGLDRSGFLGGGYPYKGIRIGICKGDGISGGYVLVRPEEIRNSSSFSAEQIRMLLNNMQIDPASNPSQIILQEDSTREGNICLTSDPVWLRHFRVYIEQNCKNDFSEDSEKCEMLKHSLEFALHKQGVGEQLSDSWGSAITFTLLGAAFSILGGVGGSFLSKRSGKNNDRSDPPPPSSPPSPPPVSAPRPLLLDASGRPLSSDSFHLKNSSSFDALGIGLKNYFEGAMNGFEGDSARMKVAKYGAGLLVVAGVGVGIYFAAPAIATALGAKGAAIVTGATGALAASTPVVTRFLQTFRMPLQFGF